MRKPYTRPAVRTAYIAQYGQDVLVASTPGRLAALQARPPWVWCAPIPWRDIHRATEPAPIYAEWIRQAAVYGFRILKPGRQKKRTPWKS